MAALDMACSMKFEGYAYFGRTVASGCKVFMMGWRDELELQL